MHDAKDHESGAPSCTIDPGLFPDIVDETMRGQSKPRKEAFASEHLRSVSSDNLCLSLSCQSFKLFAEPT
jgi:hypothetical protein